MISFYKSQKNRILWVVACIISLSAAACSPQIDRYTPAPVIQTVVITEVVTSEVTRLVENPVTNTPVPASVESMTPTETPTITRTPTITPTLTPPRVSILVHSACLYGPGSAYLFKYGLNATVWMRVIGRNQDGTWLNVRSGNDPDWNACWIKATLVKFDIGKITDVPILWTALPYSNLYPPPLVSANRVGNEVTIFWQPVGMTEDDYRGYLIEAWVCQGGKQVFLPIGYVTSFAQNTGMMAATVTDEPGCDVPSNARIYSTEKHGYSSYRMIAWPGFNSAQSATSTLTQTPTPQ
jgi:hypothetical protein